MATIDAAVCSEEMFSQCETALEAIGNLNYALMNLYQVPSGGSRYEAFKTEVFEMIYTFLGHAARISWMLWPEMNGKNGLYPKRITEAKGSPANESFSQSTLQRLLGTQKTRSLKILKRAYPYTLALRDEIPGVFQNPNILHIIGSPIAVTDCPCPTGTRIYDPTTRDFHMDGTIFPLQEIAAAIAVLNACVQREEKPPLRVLPTNSRESIREAAHL